jgi:hypothetical protein
MRSLYVPELLLDGQGVVESNAVDREHEQPAALASFDPSLSPEYDHIARRLRTLEQCALRKCALRLGASRLSRDETR